MDIFDFPYHTQSTTYPENGTRVQMGGNYIFAAPPAGPDLRTFTLSFPIMFYYEHLALAPEYIDGYNFTETVSGSPSTITGLAAGRVITTGGLSTFRRTGTVFTLRQRNVQSVLTDVYYVEAEFILSTVQAGDSVVMHVGVGGLDASYTSLGNTNIGTAITKTTAGTYIVSGYVAATSSTGIAAWTANSVFLRPYASVTGTVTGTTTVDVRRLTVLRATQWAAFPSNPRISRSRNPQYNMAVLEDFYKAHKLYKTFTYPHPVYGNVNVKFNSPLKIPEGIINGNGALKDFTVELIESPI